MKKFPREFADLLTPYGLRVLRGEAEGARSLFRDPARYFVTLTGVVRPDVAADCVEILDRHLYDTLAPLRRPIAPETITRMRRNYEERLHKTVRVRTAYFQRQTSRASVAAERINLLPMMRSESFTDFAEAVSGLRLDRDLNKQVICYGAGDYSGPHNDHHPENPDIRDGFVDFHVMFANAAVAHHYLVYAERGHFSRIVNVNVRGGVSVYKLPFWHYTTPLAARRGRESEARRWLILGTYRILPDGGA